MSGRTPEVTLLFPSMLEGIVGARRLRVKARTVSDAFEEAYARVPALRHHLCEESGRFRVHVLCLHEGEIVRERSMSRAVKEGDEISIVQAVSGG